MSTFLFWYPLPFYVRTCFLYQAELVFLFIWFFTGMLSCSFSSSTVINDRNRRQHIIVRLSHSKYQLVVTTLKRGEGIQMWKLKIEKLTRLTKQVFFGERLNYFCPWLSTPFLSMNTQRKNLAEIQRSWPQTWSITHITYSLISILFPLSRLKCIRHSWGSKLQPILGEVVVLLRPSPPEPRAWSICAVLACQDWRLGCIDIPQQLWWKGTHCDHHQVRQLHIWRIYRRVLA